MPKFGPVLVALAASLLLSACVPVSTTPSAKLHQDAYLLRSIEVEPRVQTVTVPSIEARVDSYVSARVDVMIRKGPGKSYQGCGHLPKGRLAELIDCQGDWCKIRYKGQEGWSHSRYLNFHRPEIQSQAPVQQVVEPGYRVDYVVPLRSKAAACGVNASYCIWRPTGYQATGYQAPGYQVTGQTAPVVYWSPRPPVPQGAWWEQYR